MNIIMLTGNLGKDPVMRFTPNGKEVTNISLAVWRPPVNDQEQKPIWVNVTFWGKNAERANQKLQKGSRILVQGRLDADDYGYPRQYPLKSGETGTSFEITGFSFEQMGEFSSSPKQSSKESRDAAMDDIPF